MCALQWENMHEMILNSQFAGLAITCLVYAICESLCKKFGRKSFLPPVALAIPAVILILLIFNVPYDNYYRATGIITFLLAPATVALAFPIYKQWRRLRLMWAPIIISIVFGAIVASLSGWGVAKLLTDDKVVLLTVLTKSITTPIAISCAQAIGGDGSLAAVIVVLVGIIGSITAPVY